jgi:ectoine hydroxylase-related dioxygenase (phytanoyl-CoA dioxygenase family)
MAVLETVEPVLTEAEVSRFWEQGYLLVKGVLGREEAARYRALILDMVPRDLSIPAHWHMNAGRIKPMNPDGDHTFDTPELLPLLFNERLYAVAAQLLGSPRLRSGDASLGITLRNASGGHILSQTPHLDASVPSDIENFLFTPEELQVGGCYYLGDVEPEGGGIHVVPGGHRLVEEKARGRAGGRHLYADWKRIDDFPETVEVTGEAGDFALLHHLMPHAASHNRRPAPRVAQFTRFLRAG